MTVDATVRIQNLFTDLKKRVIREILVDAFQSVANKIEDANREQLKEGERADGTVMPNYSKVSVAVYGKPAGPIKLYDTGAFYRGIRATPDEKGLTFDDTDGKTEKLVERFGENILGLQEEKFNELKDNEIVPEIQVELRKYFKV